MTQNISIALLDYNKGQLKDLPKNPRFFRDYRFEAMKKSIEESPEMLELRELIVFPYDNGRYVVVCGNLRLRACRELGYAELPCKVLDAKTKPKKLREYNPKHAIRTGLSKMPEREFKPIAVLRDGIEVERFPSIKSACNALGLTSAGVCNTLAGRISNHRGYTFKYL